MNDCIFCKIIAGDVPALKVHEDDATLAFMDAGPVNVGHVLVVPKAHHEDCLDTPDEALAAVMSAVKRVAKAAMQVTGAQGFNIHNNCGRAAGQVVMHTHMHVIPRFADDGLQHWPHRTVPKEDTERVAGEMKALLQG